MPLLAVSRRNYLNKTTRARARREDLWRYHMSIAKVGEVIGAEVTAINSAKSVVILELESAEPAIMLPSGLGDGVKFDSIHEGQQFRVLVVEKREGRNYRTSFLVSQRLDAEVFDPEHLEETAERRQP